MAVPKEGVAKKDATRRTLKNSAFTTGSTAMNSTAGSLKYATKRTLKARAGVRDNT